MDLLYKAFAWDMTPLVVILTFFLVVLWALLGWQGHLRRLRTEISFVRNHCGLGNLLRMSPVERRQVFAERMPEILGNLESAPSQHSLASDTAVFISRCRAIQTESGSWLETVDHATDCLDLRRHLLLNGVHLSFFRSLPAILVGAGLCVTFLGLAVVISKASGTLGSEDVLHELKGLLDAASNKFWSSLAAVVFSIVYGLLFRRVLHQMERVVAKLCSDLEKCVRVISLGEVQYDALTHLRTSEGYLVEMSNSLSLLKTGVDNNQSSNASNHAQLLESLGALTKNLGDQIGLVTTSVQGGFSDLKQEAAKVNEEAFAKIAADMAETLNEGLRDHLGAIAQRLEDVDERMHDVPGIFDALMQQLREFSAQIAMAFEAAAAPLEAALHNALVNAQAIGSEFSVLPEALKPAQHAADKLAEAAGSISEVATNMESQFKTLVARWNEISDVVRSVDKSLATSVRECASVFPDYADRLQKFNRDWEDAMVKSLSGLRATIEELGETHGLLHEDRTKWNEASERFNAHFQGLHEVMGRVSSQLTETFGANGQSSPSASESSVVPHSDEAQPIQQ